MSGAESFFSLGLRAPPAEGRGRRRALYDQIKGAILDGRLAPGLQLPASRALAEHLAVSRNSVVAVYDLLVSEGYVVSRQGAGSFVAPAAGAPPARPACADPRVAERLAPAWRAARPLATRPMPPLSLRLGLPDESLFPHDIWRRLANRARRQIQRRGAGYSDPFGSAALRRAIAGHASLTRAVACDAEDVVVTHGAQQAFDLLARVLVDPGRTVVAVEEPGYPPLRAAFAALGAVVRPVPVDEEGLVVDELPPEAAVVCVTPSHQFPLGVAMSPRRRLALLEWAEAREAVVVEDDYDGEFRFDARPLDALQTLDRQARVFYVGTFSKCMCPDLRLGFVACPPWARDAVAAAKQLADRSCSLAEQEALAAFIAEGHLTRHVRRMRGIYARRRQALLAALKAHCSEYLEPFPAVAGLHIAARLRRPGDVEDIVARAAAAGIGVRGIAEFAAGPGAPAGFVLGYGAVTEPVIEATVRGLAGVLQHQAPPGAKT